MNLDRQIIFAVAAAVGVMLGFSALLFGSGSPGDQPRPKYAPDDIRYRYQQADAKQKSKHKKANQPAKGEFVTDGSTSSGGGDHVSDEPAEESSAEEPTAEEPPIE